MASLGFVYGLLLGNCGYQTDRKIYDQSEIAVRLQSSRDPRAARATNLQTRSARIKQDLLHICLLYIVLSICLLVGD